MTERRQLEQWPQLLQFASALAVLLGVLLSLLLMLVGPLLHTAGIVFISCLWPAAFFAWGSWRLARVRGAKPMAAFALLNLLCCVLALLMGLLLLTAIDVAAPWDALFASLSLALIGSQVLLLWEVLRRTDAWLDAAVRLFACAAVAVAVGMIYAELSEMLALVYAVLIGGPWLWFLLQQRLRGVDTAGRGLRVLWCTVVLLIPALLALGDLGQRMHAARATLIGSWTGISAERRVSVVFGADGSVRLSSDDAPVMPDWIGRWTIRPSPFSEAPELLIDQAGADLSWWAQFESGAQHLDLRGDSSLLLRRSTPGPAHAPTSMPRKLRIDCGEADVHWQLQLDLDQRGRLQRLKADGSAQGEAYGLFWLDLPDDHGQAGLHALIAAEESAANIQSVDGRPVELQLSADHNSRLEFGGQRQRLCQWR